LNPDTGVTRPLARHEAELEGGPDHYVLQPPEITGVIRARNLADAIGSPERKQGIAD
jgi:hypothetical protein